MIPNWERKSSIPQTLPKTMESVVRRLKRSKNRVDCLSKAYNVITHRFRGERFTTYSRFHKLYERSVDVLWMAKGFIHCTHQNFLLRILLVKSGFFKDSDIRLQKTLLYTVSPHQYMRVRLSNNWIDVDPWASVFKVKLGERARGFIPDT